MDQISFVMNLNNNETEIPEDQLEEYALKLNAKYFACRSKAKAKPQRRGGNWIDIEPGKFSSFDYDVSKKVTYLLRHSRHVHREEDGTVHFWRIKENLQSQFPHSPHWSDGRWKVCLAGGGDKRIFQYCTDASGTIVYFRALHGHSGNLIIQSNFFQYICHVGCAINLHSIINSGLIPGGQHLSNRQTVFFLLVDPMDKENQDPGTIDLNAPRHAQYLNKAWKRHQNAVYWVDINLALRKGLKLCQTRANAIILQETLPAYCIPKVVRMENWRSLQRKSIHASPRPPPKISLKHDWKKELGSEDAQRPEGQVVQQFKSSQSNQPIPNPDHDRKGQPVVGTDRSGQPVVGTNTRTVQDERKTSRSQEIDVNSFREELSSSERTGRPVIETSVMQARSSEDTRDPNVEKAHERTRRLGSVTNTENVPDSSQTRS